MAITFVDKGEVVGRIYSAEELSEQLKAEWPKFRRIDKLHRELGESWHTPRRWKIIRDYYSIRKDDIERGRKMNPYELGLERFLTPIESQLWQDIRGMYLPFLMQYPVGCRFVDFGDPVQKIAIEADGKAFHSRDKDAIRDEELYAHGWTVYHIAGRDTYGKTGTKKIQEIAAFWYGREFPEEREEEWQG